MFLKQKGGLEQKVIEIEGTEVFQNLLVAGIDFRKRLREEIVCLLFESIGVDELIFQSRDCVKRSRW